MAKHDIPRVYLFTEIDGLVEAHPESYVKNPEVIRLELRDDTEVGSIFLYVTSSTNSQRSRHIASSQMLFTT